MLAGIIHNLFRNVNKQKHDNSNTFARNEIAFTKPYKVCIKNSDGTDADGIWLGDSFLYGGITREFDNLVNRVEFMYLSQYDTEINEIKEMDIILDHDNTKVDVLINLSVHYVFDKAKKRLVIDNGDQGSIY